MHVSWSDMYICDDLKFQINRTMIEIVKALWFPFSIHITAVGISFNFLFFL